MTRASPAPVARMTVPLHIYLPGNKHGVWTSAARKREAFAPLLGQRPILTVSSVF